MSWNFKSFDGKRLIILNSPFPADLINRLQKGAELVVTDGAANNLKDIVGLDTRVVIVGDMDSISKETFVYFKSRPNTEMVQVTEQDSTDFTKALDYVYRDNDFGDVYVLGGLDGRFDHTLASINTLALFSQSNIYLFNEQSTAVLLKGGKNVIETTVGNTCGFFPIHGATHVQTDGLKWDVNGVMSFGRLVSSSNCIVNSTITIQCEKPIVYINNVSQ